MLLEEGVCYDQCILLAKLFTLTCFILYSKAKFACYSTCFLTYYFCIPVPYNVKDIFFGVLVLEGLVGLHRTIQLQVFSITGWGIDLDCHDIEWFALQMNRDHSVIFETYHILHPSTAFRTLLLTIIAIPFLLRVSCPR